MFESRRSFPTGIMRIESPDLQPLRNSMRKKPLAATLLLLCGIFSGHDCFANEATTAVDQRRQAHAHNDYLHERPLLDALDNGFGSVETPLQVFPE